MSELFSRRWTLEVSQIHQSDSLGDHSVALDERETLKVTGLRVAFNVKHSLEKDPNTCSVTVTNLSEASRRKVERARGGTLTLSAGYKGSEARIFKGNIRYAVSSRDNADWHTKIECGDGETAYVSNPFSGSFNPGTLARDVISQAVTALGVGKGNAEKFYNRLIKPTMDKGFSANGRASDVLEKLLRSQGLSYSIQNGQLQIAAAGEPFDQTSFLISADTGMIGSPEVGAPDKFVTSGEQTTKSKPVIKVKSYLQPQIRCGGAVRLKTASFDSRYLVTHVEHQGDSHGAEWYTMIEANYLD